MFSYQSHIESITITNISKSEVYIKYYKLNGRYQWWVAYRESLIHVSIKTKNIDSCLLKVPYRENYKPNIKTYLQEIAGSTIL